MKKIKYKSYPINLLFFVFAIIMLPSMFKIFDHQIDKISPFKSFYFIDIVLILFGVYLKKTKKFNEYFYLETILIISFFLILRLSLIFTHGNHHRSFYELTKTFLSISIFFVFLSSDFNNNKKLILKYFFFIFFTFAFFQTILGLMQFIYQKPMGFHFIKEPLFGLNVRGSALIHLSSSKVSILNFFIHSETNKYIRATGTFIHPNVLAGFLNISILFTLYMLHAAKNKMFFACFLFSQVILLILTFSRAAFGSFLISSTLFLILMIYKNFKVKKIAISFFVVFLLITTLFSKTFIERGFLGSKMQSQKAKISALGSLSTRKTLQDVSINMIKKKPILGVGFRNFIIKREEFTSLEKIDRANVHNIYLLIASEAGVLSLLIYLVFIGVIFFKTFKYSLNDPLNICLLCIVSSFLIVGFLDHYPMSSQFGRIILFTFLGYLNLQNRINQHLLSSKVVSLSL